MPHPRVAFTVEATAAAVHRARHRVSAVVRAYGGPPDDDLFFRLELVTSELLTNALLHAGGPLSVEVTPAEDHVVVGVRDTSPVVPGPSPAETDGEHGRGLALVEALSLFQGAERTADGKRCWAVLPRTLTTTPAEGLPPGAGSHGTPADSARWSVTPAGQRLLAALLPATAPAEPR
ncbi:ATP-binding protein [Streptomyces sp. AD55]|uniref:ATP-binding protein n=1 Tax=Streptomyces sp. AD55 TaxID=3242895 RepID=UPI00352836AD